MKRNVALFVIIFFGTVMFITFQNFGIIQKDNKTILESRYRLTETRPCLNQKMIPKIKEHIISRLSFKNRSYLTTKNGLYISESLTNPVYCLKTTEHGLLTNTVEHVSVDNDGRMVLSHKMNESDLRDRTSGISISMDGGTSFKSVNFLNVPSIGDVSGYVFASNFEESKEEIEPIIYVAGGKGIFKFNVEGKYLGTVLCQLDKESHCVWNPSEIESGQQVVFKNVESRDKLQTILIKTEDGDRTYSVLPNGDIQTE